MRNRQKDDFTIAPPMRVVKSSRIPCVSIRTLFLWAVDNCRMRLADGAVKAVSRAQRGRSNAERLDRADANFTIGLDGPRTDKVDLAGICGVFSGPLHSRERRGIGARVSFASRRFWRCDRMVWPLTE
jgi:hypothetical protein